MNTLTQETPIFFIASHSSPGAVAGSIAHTIREREEAGLPAEVVLQAIGAHAVNQAVKAEIIARSHLAQTGHASTLEATFHDDIVNGVKKTAIRFHIRAKKGA